MLILLAFLTSIIYSINKSSLKYFIIFHYICFVAIYIFLLNGIDVQFKIDKSLASDTELYYSAFNSINNITYYTFWQYPLVLRILCYPIHNVLFAVWGQCTIIFLLLDIIIKKKKNLLFLIFFHALIFTSTNLFKDNFILIVGLLAYLFLGKIKNSYAQCFIISISISLIAIIRPFLAMAMPISFIPFWYKIKSEQKKKILLIIAALLFSTFLLSKKDYIEGVMHSFSGDTAVQEGKSNPVVALVKIFLGPTPMHYYFAKTHFVQPFLDSQGYLFFILHCTYYIGFSYWIIYIFKNFKQIISELFHSISKCFIFILGVSQLLCYTIIYGSADIRQRAIIITFIFLSSIIANKDIIKTKMSISEYRVWIITNLLLFLLTIMNQ